MSKVLRPAFPVHIKCHIRAVRIDDEKFALKEQSREFGSVVLTEGRATAIFSMGGTRRRFVASDAQACVDAIGWLQKGESAIRDTESELERAKDNRISVHLMLSISQKTAGLDGDLKKSASESYRQQNIRNIEEKLSRLKQEYMRALGTINGAARSS